jgi:hypothetical protein
MTTRWRSIVNIFGIGQPSKGLTAELRRTEAYRAVFHGSPSREDQEIVLADLLAKSGFNAVSDETVSSDALRYREGRRSFYSEVFAYLSLSPSDVTALQNAARLEIANAQT